MTTKALVAFITGFIVTCFILVALYLFLASVKHYGNVYYFQGGSRLTFNDKDTFIILIISVVLGSLVCGLLAPYRSYWALILHACLWAFGIVFVYASVQLSAFTAPPLSAKKIFLTFIVIGLSGMVGIITNLFKR
jgi:hypothetical protein